MVEFAYAVGRIRAIEAHLLTENEIIRMTEAKDFDSAYLVLRESPHYSKLIDQLEHPFDFESLLEKETAYTRELMKKLAPGNKLIEVIWKKSDPALPLSNYLDILSATAAESNVPLFKKYAFSFIVLSRLKLELLENKFEPERIVLQFKYTDFNQLVSAGLEHFRKTGSLFALEREIDNFLTETVKKAKYQSFGIEPLIGFCIAKEVEVKIIRLISTGKRMRLRPEEIKERLRLPYA